MSDGPNTEKDPENDEVLAKRKCNILKGPIPSVSVFLLTM